jgi:Spy/CpxP family protein refolding chaperone
MRFDTRMGMKPEMRRTRRLPTSPCARAARLRALALALPFLLLSVCASYASAQEPATRPEAQQQEAETRRPRAQRRAGGNLLRRLGLAPEQLRQLSEIRRQSEPEMRTLMRRLNQARRALDEAIYSDALDEAAVDERARELAAAQNALVHLRAVTELRVRRVLTPEQLQTFRELRQQARQRQERRRQRPRGPRRDAPTHTPLDQPAEPTPLQL